jgi:hypothetical protein
VKLLIWSLSTFGALLWTGGAWLTSSVLRWGAELIASGGAVEIGAAIGQWPVPAWLAQWVGVAGLHALLDGVVWLLDALHAAWPAIGTAVGWLVPLVWVVWAMGLAALLMLAGGLHWLTGRGTAAVPQSS